MVADRVQSVERAFALLELVADVGGSVGLSELATRSGLPLPTIHRLMRSMVTQGYVRQDASRRYALGPGLIRLGDTAGRLLGSWALPHLERLVAEIGETANLAVLDGDCVVYVAQQASSHSMRMFTEVGRRVSPHCTGVGKALLSTRSDEDVRAIVTRTGMPARTDRTLTDVDALLAAMAEIRDRGYAVDDGEQELGVRCVAVPVVGAPVEVAISVSGPDSRITTSRVEHIATVLHQVGLDLVTDLRR